MSARSITTPFALSHRGAPYGAPAGFALGAARRPPRPPVMERLGTALRAAWRRYRTRQALAELDGFLLKDIGVTYAEAEHEANKPFWVA
ncbi:MAG TPA: DUF1127 domain-containing protein [Acetobacteraceae bacterium]|nr:DUF1127 domain-containing protein [Acetobacteraceae bacterium]